MLENALVSDALVPIEITYLPDNTYMAQTYKCGPKNTIVIGLDIQKTNIMISVYCYCHCTICFCGSRTFQRPLCSDIEFPPIVCKRTVNEGKTSFITFEDGYVFYGDRHDTKNQYFDQVTSVAFLKKDVDDFLATMNF